MERRKKAMLARYLLAMRHGCHYPEHTEFLGLLKGVSETSRVLDRMERHERDWKGLKVGDRVVDLMERHERDWKGLKVGDRVEARVENDQLYYTGEIMGVSEDRCTILVEFEDKTLESTPHQWIIPFGRKIVFRGEQVLVIRGHYAVKGFPQRALFMMFKDSPQLYQSAKIESSDAVVVPFEVNQTILLSVALLRSREKAHKILVIGCGGGAVPLGYSKLCPKSSIDVVDLSEEVIDVASKYFGISDEKNIRMHARDGFSYIKSCVLSTSLHVLVVDVAAHDAVDGDDLEMPPRTFVSSEFLTHARRVLRTGGLFIVNVIARREMLKVVSGRLRKYFENVKIFGLDPNYIFFCSVCDDDVLDLNHEDLLRLVQDAEMSSVVPEILGEFLVKSEKYSKEGVAMGWVSFERFSSGLEDCDYSV